MSSLNFYVYIYSDPGLNKVVAPIIKLKDVKDLAKPHTILVTADEMEDFFTRHVSFVIYKNFMTSIQFHY